MMYGYDDSWGACGWVLMSVLMLVVLGAVIVSVLALIRSTRTPTTTPAPAAATGSASALQALDERFARREIDEADYTTRRDLLTSR